VTINRLKEGRPDEFVWKIAQNVAQSVFFVKLIHAFYRVWKKPKLGLL
jgi:hypothetical protein